MIKYIILDHYHDSFFEFYKLELALEFVQTSIDADSTADVSDFRIYRAGRLDEVKIEMQTVEVKKVKLV